MFIQVEVHGTNFSGQRARHEARKINIDYNYADSHARGRLHQRSRERQVRFIQTIHTHHFTTKDSQMQKFFSAKFALFIFEFD